MKIQTFTTLLRAYGIHYLSSMKFKLILIFYLVSPFVYAIPYLTGALPKPATIFDYAYFPFSNIAASVAFPCALLAGDTISQDFSRQGYFTLTQPVRRSEIMLTRFLSSFGTSALTMLAWIGSGSIGAWVLYRTAIPNMVPIVLFTILFVASVTSFVVLFSSLFKSSMLSIIASVVVMVILMPILIQAFEAVGVEPWPLLAYAGSVLGGLSAATYPPHILPHTASPGLPVSVTVFIPFVWEAAAIMTLYLMVSLVLAWLVYSKKEIVEIE